MKRILYCTFLFCVIASSYAQERIVDRSLHNELPDDLYIAVDRSNMPTQPAYQFRSSTWFTTQVNVDENGNDIIGDAGNEPSLAVDPTNNNRIVVGWRQFDNINNNFRQAGFGYSLDGGSSFNFPGPLTPGIFRSDPVLDFDAEGNFYYNSLQGDFSCDVFKIEDGSTNWEGPYPAFGGDKQWMVVDKTSGASAGHNYSYWNSDFSTCGNDNFTRSTDGSETFEDCILVDADPFWGTLTVDKEGDLYITGNSNQAPIVVIKSTNAQDAGANITWDFVTEVDLDGGLGFGGINPQGLLGQAWVGVDTSDGPGEGNVYVLASVARTGDPVDVMFARSTDGGESFEPPIRINNDELGNWNWFGTLSVAPNGRIDVVWLDTRNSNGGSGGFNSQLYYTFSEDQGDTWSKNQVLSELFDPTIGYPQQNKMGDYIDMVSDNDYAHVAWTATINGGQDVYYTRISPELLGLEDVGAAVLQPSISPNPVNNSTQIHFQLPDVAQTKVWVTDLNGRPVAVLLDESQSGPQVLDWGGVDAHGDTLASGMYFVHIESGPHKSVLKAVIR